MPVVIYLFALAVFAQGTSEFMLPGLLPAIASETGVSLALAGVLTAGYALGMVIGAPLMAVLGSRWPRRQALLVFLGLFMIVHVVAAMTSRFDVLLTARILGAMANAGFLAVALSTAMTLVTPDRRGRATGVLLSGVTVACIAGVPGGAVLGDLFGWRSAFWAVVVATVPAFLVLLRRDIPRPVDAGPKGIRGEFRVLRSGRLRLILVLGALVNGATFCSFTYLAPVLTERAGIPDAWIPAMFALFGTGAWGGVILGGRLADTRPLVIPVIGSPLMATGWSLLALLSGDRWAVIGLLPVVGLGSFAVGTTLIALALRAGQNAPTLGGAFATVALNVGAFLGPLLGAIAIAAGAGYVAPVWLSAGAMCLALVIGWLLRRRLVLRT